MTRRPLLRTIRTHAIAALTLLATSSSTAIGQSIEIKSPYSPLAGRAIDGRVIVKLRSHSVSRDRLESVDPSIGIYRMRPWIDPALTSGRHPAQSGILAATTDAGLARIMVVEYSSLSSPHEVAASLERSTEVEYAEPMYARHLHYYSTNDPGASMQWYLDVIGARDAWDEVRADTSIVIAIVDSGIDPTHEDLAGSLWRNAGETGSDGSGADRSTNGVDDDANGYVDDWQGYDFAGADGRSPDNDPTPSFETHGTEMAGIAGAIGNNARGTVGVAFGARLMSLKITDEPPSPSDSPDLFNGHEAILYAAKMGADVINCSWGDLGRMRSEQEVIDAATGQYGAVIVASAGNQYNDNQYYPASYDGVLSVGAVETGDAKAGFSNYNYRVDLSAPGTSIYAPVSQNGYRYGQGTSQAAAVVSGAAALVRKRYPDLAPSQVIELLRATSDDNSGVLGQYAGKLGAGRLNILNAFVHAETISSARLVTYRAVDASGDGIIDPGEAVTLRVDVRNHLAPAPSVNATLSPVSHTLVIDGPTAELGPMATGATETTSDGVFRFTAPAQVEPNATLTLKVSVATPSRANDSYVVLRIAPTFMTTDLNRIAATFNSVGNVAYNGTDRAQGDGFRRGGSRELIYHGGLMIGTSDARLSDVVRVGPLAQGTAGGLRMTSPYRIATAGDGSVEIGHAAFDDGHRSESERVGVAVEMRTYEFADAADRDYVLAVYTIRNSTAARLENLHAGLYLDWDVASLGEGDVAALDEPAKLGYVVNSLVPTTVAGAALVSGQSLAFSAVDNNEVAVSSFFPPQTKWQLLGNGIGARTTPETDAGMVIGAGPFALDPGASEKVAIMLASTGTLDELRAAAARARERFRIVSSVDGALDRVSLDAIASPNPTEGPSQIHLTLRRASEVAIRIVDVAGRVVLARSVGRLDAGEHRLTVDASGLADGIYVYEVYADGQVLRGKLVKLTE